MGQKRLLRCQNVPWRCSHSQSHSARRRRGFVLLTMAVSSLALMGGLGLAVDVGRMFVTKNELQNFCDFSSLTAAALLDGTSHGIDAAKASVTANSNKWNLGGSAVTAPAVAFASASTGPWASTVASPSTIAYVRVTASADVSLYFLPVVVSKQRASVAAQAAAGQVPITHFPRGLAPYTAVSSYTLGTGASVNYGFVQHTDYDIQWPQFNSSRAGCSANNPDKCFVSNPCDGDLKPVKSLIAQYWQSSYNGYWGGSSNSDMQKEVLDLLQLLPLSVGDNIVPSMSNGNKAAQAGYLDERASQDVNTTDVTVADYLAGTHNGRRLIVVPIVNPASVTETLIIGYGEFLLHANGPGPSNYYVKNTNGNEGFCALYVGPFNLGSINHGVGGSTGATRVALVL